MAHLEALLLCDLIVIGPEGKLQLQGIFDTVMVQNFPSQHQRAWVYFRFYPDFDRPNGGEHKLLLQLLRPSGMRESMPEMRAEPDVSGKVVGFIEMRGIPLFEEGDHHLELYYDGQEVGHCRFEVKRIPLPDSAGGKSNVTIQ